MWVVLFFSFCLYMTWSMHITFLFQISFQVHEVIQFIFIYSNLQHSYFSSNKCDMPFLWSILLHNLYSFSHLTYPMNTHLYNGEEIRPSVMNLSSFWTSKVCITYSNINHTQTNDLPHSKKKPSSNTKKSWQKKKQKGMRSIIFVFKKFPTLKRNHIKNDCFQTKRH